MEPTSPSLQKTILRLVQTQGPIDRSTLGQKTRSYDQDNWDAIIDDLVDRGLITEGSEIRLRKKNKRAVIVYVLRPLLPGLPAGLHDHPNFTDMTPEEVQKYVQQFAPRAAVAS